MQSREFTVEQNTGHIAPVTERDHMAHVEETKRKALAEQTTIEEKSAGADQKNGANNGNAEGNLLIDIGLEALGVKSAASAVQLLDDRMADKAASRPQTGNSIIDAVAETVTGALSGKAHIDGEDIMARANIAASSLALDPKHVNTDVWGGTDTKMGGVAMAKSLTFGKEIANEMVLQSVYVAEQKHSAMIGRANMMVPGLGMASGPSINPQQLLNDAERISELEDWQKRMQEAAGAV